MRYELMFPDQLREAIEKNLPVVLAAGVLEYHAEHCVPGVDTLLVSKALEELEEELEMVILPPFYYGSSSYVVAPPERKGSVHVSSEKLSPLFSDVFYSLLRIGFRNIHVFIHHQTENFADGMPTDLALKTASRQAIFTFLEKKRGESWWGEDDMAAYYEDHAEGDNPFNWIRVHPFMDAACQAEFPIDHAGKQETSLMMAFCPAGVDMKRYSGDHWYAGGAADAEPEYGLAAKRLILKGMKKAIKGAG